MKKKFPRARGTGRPSKTLYASRNPTKPKRKSLSLARRKTKEQAVDRRESAKASPPSSPSPASPPPSPASPSLSRVFASPSPGQRAASSAGALTARPWPSAAEAFELKPYSEPVPEDEDQTPKVARGAKYEAAYGHLRNGQVYPDPFPYEPPSAQEALALKLTAAQRIALEQILLGSQLSVAARSAGVTRMTLYRWLNRDPNFQAAYNTWQADAIINSRTRFLAMTNTATSTLECAVQSDPPMALAVLRASGIPKCTTTAPTDPEECERQIKQKERQSKREFQQKPQKRRLGAGSGKRNIL
jgi:hypothetical protein